MELQTKAPKKTNVKFAITGPRFSQIVWNLTHYGLILMHFVDTLKEIVKN